MIKAERFDSWEAAGINMSEIGSSMGNKKVTCPKCKERGESHGDKDLSIHITNGYGKCHKCSWRVYIAEENEKLLGDDSPSRKFVIPEKYNFKKITQPTIDYLVSRGITKEVIERHKITDYRLDGWFCYNYFDKLDKPPLNFKARNIREKDFRQQGGAENILYKIYDLREKSVVGITEGEPDALSWEVAGKEFFASLPLGAPNPEDEHVDKKLASITRDFDVFENADLIYISVDADKNGKFLEKLLIKKFGAEKCKLVRYPEGLKDANEVLKKFGPELGPEILNECFDNAEDAKEDGIYTVSDCESDLWSDFENGTSHGETTRIPELDKHLTFKTGNVYTWTGYTNEGKSEFIRYLHVIKSAFDDWKHAWYPPENLPLKNFYGKIIHTYIGKSIDKRYSGVMNDDEFSKGIEFVRDHFYVIDPEVPTVESILEKAVYLIRRYGVKTVVLDPYNQIDHDVREGEHLYIAKFFSKLKAIARRYDVIVFVIMHQTTPKVEAGKNYDKPNKYRVKGGGTAADKSDVMGYTQRPEFNLDTQDRRVVCGTLKIREKEIIGYEGEVEFMYSPASGRYLIDGKSPLEDINPVENYQSFFATDFPDDAIEDARDRFDGRQDDDLDVPF